MGLGGWVHAGFAGPLTSTVMSGGVGYTRKASLTAHLTSALLKRPGIKGLKDKRK